MPRFLVRVACYILLFLGFVLVRPAAVHAQYSCDGYCAPDISECGADVCGSGDCDTWVCCKSCVTTPTPTPTPSCGLADGACCTTAPHCHVNNYFCEFQVCRFEACGMTGQGCCPSGQQCIENGGYCDEGQCRVNCAWNVDCHENLPAFSTCCSSGPPCSDPWECLGYSCKDGEMVTENFTQCALDCVLNSGGMGCTYASYNCYTTGSCTAGCHVTHCWNVKGIIECISGGNPEGWANTDDCAWPKGIVICGVDNSCPDGPTPTSVPFPTDTPIGTLTPTPTDTPTSTPVPGMIKARAMQVTEPNTSCADINSGTGITGATFSFSPSLPSQPAQSGTGYVTFPNAPPTTYEIFPNVPSQYALKRYCSGGFEVTNFQTLAPSGTVTWDIGYGLGTAWSQAEGADVYAAVNLKSPVPVPHPPPPAPATNVFILDGTTGGYPGLATCGNTCSVDGTGVTNGQDWVSNKKWMAQDTAPGTDFYKLMYGYLGGAPTSVDYVNPVSPITNPLIASPARTTPYYVTGDMTTSGNWSVASGQKLVFLVDGKLTIKGNITIAHGGFAAFIVNGKITVDPAVADVQGVYITSPTGVFDTGTTGLRNDVRFVGTGMFIAGNFTLARDIGDAGNSTSAELFTYNPELWMLMPQQMQKLSVSWQEVAP